MKSDIDGVFAQGGTPTEITQRLFDLAHAAYWKQKDLPSSISYSQAGLQYALSQADLAPDPETSLKLRGQAKAIAFNLASFTWPAWDEPGIHPTPADQTIGRDAAALNLKLAINLNRPPAPLANAHWLFGAHALSANDHDAALQSFASYRTLAPTEDHRHLADGYTAITLLAASRDLPAATTQFNAAHASLKQINTEDSNFFADQLISVRRFFVR